MSVHYDVVVIGSGPAGQKAAVQSAKSGFRVVICEQLKEVGGACVHRGTIPSKALRERAVERNQARRALGAARGAMLPEGSVADLIGEMTDIVMAHDEYMTEQLERNGVDILHGRVRFRTPHTLTVLRTDGSTVDLEADHVVIATGSKPRRPDNVPVDHENIYDSDSILSLAYLPQSMVVLGGGVIACEYASIFALLGVEVTLIDRYPQPLGFLDRDLIEPFVHAFERNGGTFLGESDVDVVEFDGISEVHTHLVGGRTVVADKVLCALGRVSQLGGLDIERAGVVVNDRDLVDVDAVGRTNIPHIYAAGDVVGPPSLASASMEQGRRVACAIAGLDAGSTGHWVPTGIYAVPELASVGITETQCAEQFGGAVTGYAQFREIARGQISHNQSGMLKLVVSPDDGVVRGVHIVGQQATELIHIGQMGLIQGATVATFVENVFNFPTYAESYRVAALHAAAGLRAGQGASQVA